MLNILSVLAIATEAQLEVSMVNAENSLLLASRLGTLEDVIQSGVHHDLVLSEMAFRQGRRYGWSGGFRPGGWEEK